MPRAAKGKPAKRRAPKRDKSAAVEARDPGGRPSDYAVKYCETAAELYQDGATDVEVADTIGINVATLYRWRARHTEFREASKLGKKAANVRVERSLFNRAVGYSYDAVKVFQYEGSPVVVEVREHVPPDVGAAKHWLANCDREKWSKAAEGNLTADAAFLEMLKLVSGGKS